MLRASAVCEQAGVPTASLTCEGFVGQFRATSVGLGMPNIPYALVPGHPGSQSKDELRRNILGVTLAQVIENLTRAPAAADDKREPGARDIIFRGGLDALNRYFAESELSDGLPVIPPTRERIAAFLRFTDRQAEEVLGAPLPDKRAATVWSIAVNGVMAGCRPQYMPILVALVEAMVDPAYGVEHSGNTPGGEALVVLNGPIVKQLGFNYTQGVMRDGFVPNTSVGRFWRLYLRNVVGFLPHKTDKATYGNTWRVVIAENEDVLAKIGWEPNSVEMGFKAGDNTVTISRFVGGNHLSSVSGSTPEALLPFVADGLRKQASWTILFGMSGTLRPLVLLSPILAETIANAGWSKRDVKNYLYVHTRIPAWEFERMVGLWTAHPNWNLAEQERLGNVPKPFHESDDPNRLVPIVWAADDFMIAVTGDPGRNSAYVFSHNGVLGYPVGRQIRLPADWEALLREYSA